MGSAVVCKRDGRVMYLVEEAEKMSDGTARLTFYYKCPVCGYRIAIEQCIVKTSGEEITVRWIRKI